MRFVKAALFGVIVVCLAMMWSARHTVAEAYETTPNSLQLRLSGVDLAVARTELSPSPYAVPAAPDTRDQALSGPSTAEVAAAPSPVATNGGRARIRGTIEGPEGPVAGATVRVERHTSDGVGVLQASADEDGRWSFDGLPGGRYRIRAWVPGLMTTGRSEVTFLTDEGRAEFAFSLWGVDAAPALEFVDGGPIYDGHNGTVAVVLTSRSIDVDGIVVTSPVSGAVISVEVSPDVTLASSPVQFTDQSGAARYVLACPAASLSAGVGSAGVLVARSGSLVSTFPLPGCQPVPAEHGEAAPSGGADG